MKKLISLLAAVVITSAAAVSPAATAETDKSYLPTLYMMPSDTQGLVQLDSYHYFLSRSQLTGDTTAVPFSVYINDTSAILYNVSPKVKCASEYIKLRSGVIPKPCAYDYSVQPYSGLISCAEAYNTVNAKFTTVLLLADSSKIGSPLVFTGDSSDSYPLVNFDALIDSNAPDGTYELYFLTQKEDDPDQPICEVSFRYDADDRVTALPLVESVYLLIGDEIPAYQPGDVNLDGLVDSADSSLILYANAKLTEEVDTFTDFQKSLADVNHDGIYDSVDASLILVYSAALVDGETRSFGEWLKSQ